MSGVPARFWGSPIRYLRWAAHEKPAIFWSCIIGGLGPATFVVIPPLRRWVGDEDPPRIPLTYPGTFTMTGGRQISHAWAFLSVSFGVETWGRRAGGDTESGLMLAWWWA
jgi:hypothetical protein